jgi:hypothetical protein
METLEHRRRRLRRARTLIRFELGLALTAPPLALFYWVAAPNMMGGGMHEPPLIETLAPWVGVGTYVIGLAWMLRLSRPDPEPGEHSWRYRAFD